MHVELWELSRIRPYDKNLRVNPQAVEAVMASIREFGFHQPIVVDTETVIIVGHTRSKAAQRLNLERVPVHMATDLVPAQIKAYRLADNQLATLAEWRFRSVASMGEVVSNSLIDWANRAGGRLSFARRLSRAGQHRTGCARSLPANDGRAFPRCARDLRNTRTMRIPTHVCTEID
jgi:hypothetical protein